jgi:hypothetical protein
MANAISAGMSLAARLDGCRTDTSHRPTKDPGGGVACGGGFCGAACAVITAATSAMMRTLAARMIARITSSC